MQRVLPLASICVDPHHLVLFHHRGGENRGISLSLLITCSITCTLHQRAKPQVAGFSRLGSEIVKVKGEETVIQDINVSSLTRDFFFKNSIVHLEFLPCEIRVAFREESRPRQSRATKRTLHAELF